jgi:Receptor family ligand binding region
MVDCTRLQWCTVTETIQRLLTVYVCVCVCCTVCSLISNGLFALFGVANETSRSALDAITRTFRMPFVTTSVPINSLPPLTSLSSSSSSGGSSKSASVSVNKPLPPPSTSTSSGGLGAGVGPSSSPWLQSSPSLSSVADFTVYMRPTYDRALVDVIRYYKWQNVSYVYDSNDG